MSFRTRTCLTVSLIVCAVAATHICLAADAPNAGPGYKAPARFAVTTDVVNADVPAFTATIGAFGNSFIRSGGGFEPGFYRSRYDALEDSPDRIVVGYRITHYDTLREGFLDGGRARVYRIINGKFTLVRDEAIPQGGFHASGWMDMTGSKLVPPGTTKYVWRWDGWNRPGVPYYFTVRAVDKNGNESDAAKAVQVAMPKEGSKGRPQNKLANFKLPRNPKVADGPPTPSNLKGRMQPDGTFALTWSAVRAADLAGYRVYRSDYAPKDQKGFYIQLAGKAATPEAGVKAGDFVIVEKKFHSYSRKRYCSNRVWGASSANRVAMPALVDFYPDEHRTKTWELAPHEAGTPVENGGETYLKLMLKEGASTSIATYNHAGSGQDWYKVLEAKPYKVDVWLRREGAGTGEVRFRIGGYFESKIEPVTFRVGAEWKKYETTFTPPEVQPGSQPNQMLLEFTGPGVYSVDNLRVYRADTPCMDYLPREYAAIKESGMMSLRTHGPIKTGSRTYDMQQFTNLGGANGVRYQNTLPQELAMMRRAGVHPWLQIEMHMTPAEWQGFVEYIAAPYDPAKDTAAAKPWAAKRHAQGQTKPWTDEFEKIYFEISNETWNWLFRPWVFEGLTDAATGKQYPRGEVYGMFQEHVRESMRKSPYWNQAGLDDKIVFVLGGWSGSSYGRQAAVGSPNSLFMTVAAYNGGWDEGEGPPQVNDPSFFNVLAQVNQTALPRAQQHLKELLTIRAQGAPKMMLGTYEAGPGYALNGLNNAKVTKEQARQQELVMKSMAAGTATLDSFLVRTYHGFVIQNFFTMGQGYYWKSHAKWYRGGQAYPSWKLLALFNREGLGDMLRTQTASVPTVGLQKFRRRQAIPNAPLAAVYATRSGDRFNVFVVSRKIAGYPVKGDDGYTPVTIDLPFTKVKSITLHKMAGDPKANNLTADDVKIQTVDIPVAQFAQQFALNAARGADKRGLPPAATFLYVFEGTDAPPGQAVPLGTVLPK
jgi:hypothetical protein